MLAAVMPLPSEEVTPPVTKTYFAIGRAPPGVFPMLPDRSSDGQRAPHAVAPGAARHPPLQRWTMRGLRTHRRHRRTAVRSAIACFHRRR